MIIFWILLGLICYLGPIILMFYAYSLELKNHRTVVTIGDIWSYVDEEIAALTFTPVIGLFMCLYYIFKIIFYKIKDIQI